MTGDAKRNRVEARRDQIGDGVAVAPADDEGQRTRPERFRQTRSLARQYRQLAGLGDRWNMYDERIEARAPLGREYAQDRVGIGGVGSKPVDGFGGHADQPAL